MYARGNPMKYNDLTGHDATDGIPTRPGESDPQGLSDLEKFQQSLVYRDQVYDAQIAAQQEQALLATPVEAVQPAPAPNAPASVGDTALADPNASPQLGESGTVGESTVTLQGRAIELHSLRPNEYDRNNTTTAIVRTINQEGKVVDLVAHNSGKLSAQQLADLNTNEEAVPYLNAPGMHAEQRALIYANAQNLTPIEAAASRGICKPCASLLYDSGAVPVSPLKPR